MSQLSIVHWNDVYRVTPQKVSPTRDGDTIDVTQFATILDQIRSHWRTRSDGTPDGLSLFSGDLFSPSVESAVTRGSHMVPVMNALGTDVAVAGNHEFDFGYPNFCELAQDTKFPWLLSNIIDENTNDVPKCLHRFHILERSGVRVGFIGLVEEDWISTLPAWPANFKFRDMAETGRDLSRLLRGEHQCDFIIALTHVRIANDIQLAKDLLALSPSAQHIDPISGEHGADIILGGHDHLYFVSKGVTTWEEYDITKPSIGAEDDNGDVLVIKSGTDFRELSELTLELADTLPGSVRKKIIKAVHGKRHEIKPGMPSSQKLQDILHKVLSSVSDSMNKPVCITEVELDLRSEILRTEETVAGNWFADVLRHAYDDALYTKYGSGSDGTLITAGTLRGDSQYPPGTITVGNILEILPFDDPAVVIELDGESLWNVLEDALSRHPAQEGQVRFPILSGFRVSWDSRRPPGQRVLGIWLLQKVASTGSTGSKGEEIAIVDGESVKREKSGRTYKIVTREYLATGHDGYTVLAGHQYLIDEEHGQLPSSLVRRYLLGAQYINKMVRSLGKKLGASHLHSATADAVKREFEHREALVGDALPFGKVAQRWQRAAAMALHRDNLHSGAHYQDHYDVCAREHMDGVDIYNGRKIRRGSLGIGVNICKDDLLVIHPVVDGRLKDVARSLP